MLFPVYRGLGIAPNIEPPVVKIQNILPLILWLRLFRKNGSHITHQDS
jgi:hypothetical protein